MTSRASMYSGECPRPEPEMPKCPKKPRCKTPVWKRIIVELLATYFVLTIQGVVAETSQSYAMSALLQGLVWAAVAASHYHSGPIVHGIATIVAMFIGGEFLPKIRIGTGLLYLVAQLIGSLLAGLTLCALLPAGSAIGVPAIASGVSTGTAFLAEFLGALLVIITIVIVNTSYNRENRASLRFNNPTLTIGLAVAAGTILAITVSGGSINPWRHFSGGVFKSGYSDAGTALLVYWLAPLTAGIAAWVLYMFVLRE